MGYGYRGSYYTDPFYQPAGLGIDISDGDPVVNLGGGFGVDIADGELEYEIAPGIDIPLGDFGW